MKVAFGALAPKLHEQLPVSARSVRLLQRYADAISLLLIGGCLSDGEAHRARQRLMKRLMKRIPSTPKPSEDA